MLIYLYQVKFNIQNKNIKKIEIGKYTNKK
jgi:hypothetical protein